MEIDVASRSQHFLLQGIAESIAAPVVFLKPDGSIEAINQRLLDFFGKTRAQMEGWQSSEIIHPDDRQRTIDALKVAIATGQPYEVEARRRRTDGVYRWWRSNGNPMRDREGRILRWCVLYTDIHDRKLAEEALRQQEFLSSAMLESIGVPMSLWKPNGDLEAVNSHALNWHGKMLDELEGDDWYTVIHPDDHQTEKDAFQRALKDGQAYTVDLRFLDDEGVWRWRQLRPFPMRNADGDIVRWCVINLDIDDRKRAEEALAASERRLEQIIDTIPAMAWSANPDGTCDFFNKHHLDFVGRDLKDMQGIGFVSTFHPDDIGRLMGAWKLMLETGRPGEVEGRIRRLDGEYRWCLFRTNPLHDAEGRLVKWFGVNIDMEDRRLAQDELRQTQAELAHVSRAMTMGQLTASIAHELNQPLSGIMTNAGTGTRMLNADPPNVHGARETLKRTIRDAQRASDVITRLRAMFARRPATEELVDINAAIREVMALASHELQRKRVAVQARLDPKIPTFMGDRVQLQQVILNLLLNGAEAMDEVSDRPRELAVATTFDAAGEVQVSIKDHGTGFDQAATDRMFAPFFTTKGKGMGIGLSVSRTIVENHKGRIWALNNDGPGATFCFSVPLAAIESGV
jgi:PAS domain S-box-containing protein